MDSLDSGLLDGLTMTNLTEKFFALVAGEPNIDEDRANELCDKTGWNITEITNLATDFKQYCSSFPPDTFEEDIQSGKARRVMEKHQFQNSLGLLGYHSGTSTDPANRRPTLLATFLFDLCAEPGTTSPTSIRFDEWAAIFYILIQGHLKGAKIVRPCLNNNIPKGFSNRAKPLPASGIAMGYTWDYLHVISELSNELKASDLQIALATVQECFNTWNFSHTETATSITRVSKLAPVILRHGYLDGRIAHTIIYSFLGLDIKQNIESVKVGWILQPGHQNFNLALNIQLGIQLSVESHAHEEKTSSRVDAELTQETFEYVLPAIPCFDIENEWGEFMGEKIFTFTDYAPRVFRGIRYHFGIKDEDYLASCGIKHLVLNLIFAGRLLSFQQQSSQGKSGSEFFYTFDNNFLIKTISNAEVGSLLEILGSYYTHIISGPTLLVPIIGMFNIVDNMEEKNITCIVMKNAFNSKNDIHVAYDLKGSAIGRSTEDKDKKPGVTLKDLDFNHVISLSDSAYEYVSNTLTRDTKFLSLSNTMDYSLLLGIHTIGDNSVHDYDGIPHRPCFLNASSCKEIFYMGIIDYLTPYSLFKKLEHELKGSWWDKQKISAVPPGEYAQRFVSFLMASVQIAKPSVEKAN